MAQRPVFSPDPTGALVREAPVGFEWSAGFALAQKRRNIEALHRAADRELSLAPLLEVSSRSARSLGVRLSAFNLRLPTREAGGQLLLEAAFQGSKVFSVSGQHAEIYSMQAGGAIKAFMRQFSTERVVGFQFEGRTWDPEPKTVFYDWLYLRALTGLLRVRPRLMGELRSFAGFTDIEFNPRKSLNCQARSCALAIALSSLADLGELAKDPDQFLRVLNSRGYGGQPAQGTLL